MDPLQLRRTAAVGSSGRNATATSDTAADNNPQQQPDTRPHSSSSRTAGTPTRKLVETSVVVRETARKLARVTVTWDRPRNIVLITKPDDSVVAKARKVVEFLLGLAEGQEGAEERMALFVEDRVLLNPLFHSALPEEQPADHHQVPPQRRPSATSSTPWNGKYALHPSIRAWNAETVRQSQLMQSSLVKRADDSSPNAEDPTAAAAAPPTTKSQPASTQTTPNNFGFLSPPSTAVSIVSPPFLEKTVPLPVFSNVCMLTGANNECLTVEDIDFVITLGGDGTVLFASWLFQSNVPPLLPFHLGSLGFLTVFDFGQYEQILTKIMRSTNTFSMANLSSANGGRSHDGFAPPTFAAHGGLPFTSPTSTTSHSSPHAPFPPMMPVPPPGLRILLRMRFTCSVYRYKTILQPTPLAKERPLGGFTESDAETTTAASVSPPASRPSKPRRTMYTIGRRVYSINGSEDGDSSSQMPLNGETTGELAPPEPDAVFQILNDLVVDRGPSPYMSELQVFGDGRHLTTVQADGLVVSTPTGSTAYSLSAGGSLVHPEVPAILVTPICPHTLSFRPMLLPDSMDLKIVVPVDSRNGAWASFDGRHRIELQHGDAIVVTASRYPVPTICQAEQTSDWFQSLRRCLQWNERSSKRQLNFVWGQGVVEEDSAP